MSTGAAVNGRRGAVRMTKLCAHNTVHNLKNVSRGALAQHDMAVRIGRNQRNSSSVRVCERACAPGLALQVAVNTLKVLQTLDEIAELLKVGADVRVCGGVLNAYPKEIKTQKEGVRPWGRGCGCGCGSGSVYVCAALRCCVCVCVGGRLAGPGISCMRLSRLWQQLPGPAPGGGCCSHED
mgnify:CR=1 FL=1